MRFQNKQYDARKIRRFLVHLLVAANKHRSLNYARKELSEHLMQMQGLHSDPTALHRAYDELHSHIDKVIQAERPKTDPLAERMLRLEAKLTRYLDIQEERGKRSLALERKINRRVLETRGQIRTINAEVRKLEGHYRKLRQSGKHSKEKLATVKRRLDNVKQILKSKKATVQR